jgi:hypothetical protein
MATRSDPIQMPPRTPLVEGARTPGPGNPIFDVLKDFLPALKEGAAPSPDRALVVLSQALVEQAQFLRGEIQYWRQRATQLEEKLNERDRPAAGE